MREIQRGRGDLKLNRGKGGGERESQREGNDQPIDRSTE